MRKKILLDSRWIKTNQYDGIGKYSQKMFLHLNTLFSTEVDFYFLIDNDEVKSFLPKKDDSYFIKTNKPFHPLEAFQGFRLRKYKFDLIYSPFCIFGYYFINCPLIITIHDMTRHKLSTIDWSSIKTGIIDILRKKVYIKMRLRFEKRIAKKSTVITVSKVSFMDIEKYLGVPSIIISPGIDKSSIVTIGNSDYKKQIVYCGRYEKYKNIEKIISYLKEVEGIQFIIIGGISSENQLNILKGVDTKIKKRITFLGGISDENYKKELYKSMALINLSSLEGFGMSIIEAMAAGLPVLCSDIDVFKEAGGGAEIIIKTKDDFKRSINMLEDKDKWLEISKASILNARKYTWDKKAGKLYSHMLSLIR